MNEISNYIWTSWIYGSIFPKQMWNFLKGTNIPQNIYGGQDCIWYADTLLTRLFPDSINDCNIVISISICTNTV